LVELASYFRVLITPINIGLSMQLPLLIRRHWLVTDPYSTLVLSPFDDQNFCYNLSNLPAYPIGRELRYYKLGKQFIHGVLLLLIFYAKKN
jgi:hypothetical protein